MNVPKGNYGRRKAMRTHCLRLFTCLILGGTMLYAGSPVMAQDGSQAPTDGFFGAMAKSLTGDVYGDPSKWRELSLNNFFTEGWNRAWVSPPPGGGGAPRQGWLNSFDGVFYRLAVGTYGYAHDFLENGNQHSGTLQAYLPFNQRLEFRIDLPVVSNRGAPPAVPIGSSPGATSNDYETNFGDM